MFGLVPGPVVGGVGSRNKEMPLTEVRIVDFPFSLDRQMLI